MRQHCRRAAAAIVALAIVSVALAACGGSSARSSRTASATTPAAATAIATPSSPPFLTAAARERAITPVANPTFTPCKILVNVAPGTAEEIYNEHGRPGYCSAGADIILGVDGSSSADERPGFMVCTPPSGNPGPDCGIYVGPKPNLANWSFYPFPANDARLVGRPVFPQQYQCVGNATQLWAFHLDTHTYTPGCQPPPDETGILLRPCDAFLYAGTQTTHELFVEHGKAVACGLFGSLVVGVVDGRPVPGLVVCDNAPSENAEQAAMNCGFWYGPALALTPTPWSFFPLPVASGPVDNATFDTAAGTACVTVGDQSFTFTVASRAITGGCSP